MIRRIAKDWSAALKSNQFRQGRSYLRRQDSYCPLGVLCEISQRGEWIKDGGVYKYASGKNLAITDLPPEVKKWAGMHTHNGGRKIGPAIYKLNDSGLTFNEIAEIIDREWEGL